MYSFAVEALSTYGLVAQAEEHRFCKADRRVSTTRVSSKFPIPPQKGGRKSDAGSEIGKTGIASSRFGCEGMIGESLQLRFGAGLKSVSELNDPTELVGRSPATKFRPGYNQAEDGRAHIPADAGSPPAPGTINPVAFGQAGTRPDQFSL